MNKIIENIKKEKGVTLVALVVTIIVLLILAFIAISILMGDDGIIKKAEESKEETIKAQEREYIKLAYQDLEMEYRLNGTDITADRVMGKLQEYDSNIKVEMITKDEIGDTEIVVEKNSGEEYAEIVFTETEHKYAGSLVIDQNKTRYEVTYNANRGSGGPTKQVKIEGTPLTITLERPERKGYNFIGWARESTAVVAEYMSGSQYTEDANITLYAVWQLRTDIDPVAQIGSTKYPSIQEAIYDCSQEAGEEETTIILLKDTEEEFTTFEGQNIILDLQGHVVTSESEGALCTNNGKLQIINGSLSSNKGTSILNNGEITIGDNSTGIDDNTPTIYGNKVGVDNKGTFNYYDGKIQGIVPIQGTTTSTPDQYGPVQTGYENGISTIQLRILTQYEARIGWVYYETLQGAIDIAKAKETVTLIKDLQLKEILQVGETKDVILDLYGYELTVASGLNTVIKNYGDLEITDNSIEQKGKVSIYSSIKADVATIRNEENGDIILQNGEIYSNNAFTDESRCKNYGIYNSSTGKVEIKNGNIKSSTSSKTTYCYGIYSNIGKIIITGGKIETEHIGSSYGDYGIYNAENSELEIINGTINSNKYIICNSSTNNVFIRGGELNCISEGSYLYGIYNSNIGNVEISGGTITMADGFSFTYGIYNYSSGKIIIKDGKLIAHGNLIYNEKNGIIQIMGGSLETDSRVGNNYGIFNKQSGIIEIKGGIIKTPYVNSIYNYDSGKIIIGDENASFIQNNPEIISETTGIRNSSLGELEFYNGIIQAKVALNGNITRIREGYKVEKSIIDELESIYLVEKTNTEYIVQIENNKYYSLKEAIESIEEEKTIQVLRDFELDEIIEFNKNITLDLNGYVITNEYYEMVNNKNLTIQDTTQMKNGIINSKYIGIKNEQSGTIEINSGTINSGSYGIYNDGNANINVLGGQIISQSYGIYNKNTGELKISNGKITATNYAIYNESSGKIEIINGEINASKYGIYNKSGTLKIQESNIISTGYGTYGIYNHSGNVMMKSVTISSTSKSNYDNYGIYNLSGNVLMESGTITTNSTHRAYGIYNDSGDTTIVSGTIISNSNEYCKGSYGIYNSTGSVTMGKKADGIVAQDEPSIVGIISSRAENYEGYGIYNIKGEFYFYDGKIEETTKAVYGIITEKEENTEFNYNEDETVLTLSTEKLPIAQIDNITYTDLQEAINSVTEENTIIKILRNVTYTLNNTVITIPNNKDIILDLNGYKISSSISEKTIQNEGELEIIDTSQEKTGIITTNEETTIYNVQNAKLILTEGTIDNKNKFVILNEGEVVVRGGTINFNNRVEHATGYGIYNKGNGNIIIEEGMINIDNPENQSFSYGIYNVDKGNIRITGGTINCFSEINGKAYGIYNNNGNIIMQDGNITIKSDNGYGIYNKNDGNVIIEKGTIDNSNDDNNKYGIYNNGTGSITIGKKGDGIISQEEPYIKGNYTGKLTNYSGYGIYNPKGTLYYYDGKIQGTNKAIYGNITEIENLTEINLTEETVDGKILDTIILSQITDNVVSVNGTEYDSIQKAIESCGETESTIEILRDSNPGATIIIEENQNITIDLKGHTINNYTELQNKGTLKIIDILEEQTGKIAGLTGTVISNTGILEIQGGAISDSGYGIKNTGTITLNGGKITGNTYGIYNDSNGIINIEQGNISSNTYGIYNYSSSSVTNINEGTITSNEYGIYNYSGTTNITTKGITSNTYGVYVAGGTVTVKEGAEIQSETGIYVSSGTLNIGETGTMNSDSPIIIGETYGLTVSGAGKVYMYDGQVKGKTGATEGYITYTEEGYVVANKTEGEYIVDYLALGGTANAVAQVNGVSYSNLQSAINSITGGEEQTIILLNGIVSTETYTIAQGQNIKLDMNGKTITSEAEETINNSGNLTIIDTSGKNVAKITSTTGTAIVNSGTLTLGEDEGTVTERLITIEGETEGIENTGTLNIYDGTIIGTTAIEGEVNKTPSGYTITTTTVDGKQKATLTK